MNGNPSNRIVYGRAGVIWHNRLCRVLQNSHTERNLGIRPGMTVRPRSILGTLGGALHTIAVGKIRSARLLTSEKRLAQEAIDLMLLRQANRGKCATTQTK